MKMAVSVAVEMVNSWALLLEASMDEPMGNQMGDSTEYSMVGLMVHTTEPSSVAP